MIVRSYYLLKLEEQKKKQAQQISVRQIELEDVKENLEESIRKAKSLKGEIRRSLPTKTNGTERKD